MLQFCGLLPVCDYPLILAIVLTPDPATIASKSHLQVDNAPAKTRNTGEKVGIMIQLDVKGSIFKTEEGTGWRYGGDDGNKNKHP